MSAVEPGDSADRDRLLVVGGEAALATAVRDFYPDWAVEAAPDYLTGIALAARTAPRAILAWVDRRTARPSRVVAGLRAASRGSRLVLCCRPEDEPDAMRVAQGVADDYVIHPVERREMDRAIGRPSAEDVQASMPAPRERDAAGELAEVDRLLRQVEGAPGALLQTLAGIVRRLVPAAGVTVIVEGAVATDGAPVSRPVIAAPIERDGQAIGQIMVGEPVGQAFSPGDVATLAQYARLAERLLQMSSSARNYRRLAMTDEATGLPNRRFLLNRLRSIIDEASRERNAVSLLLFDIDDFKSYNDDYGHDVGDLVLKAVGELFERNCRKHDVIARYGGDEFAVIFWDPQGPRVPGSKHPESALEIVDRVMGALSRGELPLPDSRVRGRVTISGGLASWPWDAPDVEGLLRAADGALLQAKQAGKNRVLQIGRRSG